MYYQDVEAVLAECEDSGALGTLTPVVLAYMTEKVQSGTESERDLLQRVTEADCHV